MHPLVFIGIDKFGHRGQVFRKRHPTRYFSHGCQIPENPCLYPNLLEIMKIHGCQISENPCLYPNLLEAKEILGCQIQDTPRLYLNLIGVAQELFTAPALFTTMSVKDAD